MWHRFRYYLGQCCLSFNWFCLSFKRFCFWWRKIMNLCILGTRRSSRMSPPLECSNVPGKGWFEYVIGWSTYVYHVHALLSINLSLISESHLDIWKRRMFKTRLSRAELKRLNRKIAKTHLSVNIQCRYNSEIQKIWLNLQKFSKIFKRFNNFIKINEAL